MQIDYIEFSSSAIWETKDFFTRAFGWSFNDYGPDYQELDGAGISGGIAAENPPSPPLIVLKTEDLEAALAQVSAAGAAITREIFSFPGGRRFHFREPGGTEMGVWSES